MTRPRPDRHKPRPNPIPYRAPREIRDWLRAENARTGEPVGTLLTQAVQLLIHARATAPTGDPR